MPASSDALAFTPALELAGLVRSRTVSPTELAELFLDRIERLDGELNAFATVDPEGALAAAREAEACLDDPDPPPFLGVPTAVKDLHLTRGLLTTFGTSAFESFVPEVDDESVVRLRRAGFVLLGKTNVPEFGTAPFSESALLGPCRNPWNPAHTPGGSSGGAAAALAAGMVPVAHGSDGAGSIRIPASNCGLFGVKPSRGRVSNAPLYGGALGLGSAGPLARNVTDAAAMLDAMRGYHLGDPTWAADPERAYLEEARTDPPRLRIGVVSTSPLAEFGPVALAALEEATALLADLGHDLGPLVLPIDAGFVTPFETLWASNLASLPVDHAGLERFNAELAAMGAAYSAPDVLRAVQTLQMASARIVQETDAYDVVLCPTLTREPLAIGELAGLRLRETLDALAGYVGLTPVANVTGQPAMNLPLHVSESGLPVGVMVTGRPADEATLFRLAGQVQRAFDWTKVLSPLAIGA